MSMQHYDVVEHTIQTFTAEVVARTLDGWAVSQTNPGDAVGFGQTYTVSMYRDESTVEAARKALAGMGEKPKKSRAEILADARAAKSAKARLDTDTVR